MSIEIKNLSYLEVLSEDQEVKGGFRWGGHRRGSRGGGYQPTYSNEAGAEAFATGLGNNTKSFTSINADAIAGFGSSSRSEGFAGAYS